MVQKYKVITLEEGNVVVDETKELKGCICSMCQPDIFPERITFCKCACGNKRCPHGINHVYKCTNSNELNQIPEIDKEIIIASEYPHYIDKNIPMYKKISYIQQPVIEFETEQVKDFAKGEGFGGAGSIDIETIKIVTDENGQNWCYVK